jgi:hypothetical protein
LWKWGKQGKSETDIMVGDVPCPFTLAQECKFHRKTPLLSQKGLNITDLNLKPNGSISSGHPFGALPYTQK